MGIEFFVHIATLTILSNVVKVVQVNNSTNVKKQSHAKVVLIGGGKDVSSSNLLGASRKLQRHGTKTAILFDEDENHYFMVHQKERTIDFLNRELELI